MRRLGFLAAVLTAGTLLIVSVSSAKPPRPAISLHVASSVVVDGSHFRGHERVKVSASSGASATVRASSRGSFTITLHGGTPIDRCSALVVRAQGSAGSSAMARRPPLPACAPAGGVGSPA